MDVSEARALNKELQIRVMAMIRVYEEATGLRITKAEMVTFSDKRFFSTTVFMSPKVKDFRED